MLKTLRSEENVIITIGALKKIMAVFLGPFLTAYFIKISTESLVDLSFYYIFSYTLLALTAFAVCNMIKTKFQIGMFRVGVVLNFCYILAILILRENLVNYLWLVALLYGISSSTYWMPCNLFVSNKIEHARRTKYAVKNRIVSSVVGIVCPLLLGSIITATNYVMTGILILIISLLQILLSFILIPEKTNQLPRFSLRKAWQSLRREPQLKHLAVVEFLAGMNNTDSALDTLIIVVILGAFKTDLNLGAITSLATLLSIVAVYWYGRRYKHKSDRNLAVVMSALPVLAVLVLLLWWNDVTLLLYNIFYVIAVTLLILMRDIRLFNVANSEMVGVWQSEFFALREFMLNLGRVVGYTVLLLAAISGNQIILNGALVLLTLSIPAVGLGIRKVRRLVNSNEKVA